MFVLVSYNAERSLQYLLFDSIEITKVAVMILMMSFSSYCLMI